MLYKIENGFLVPVRHGVPILPLEDGVYKAAEQCLFLDFETTGLPVDPSLSFMDVDNWPRVVSVGMCGAGIETSGQVIVEFTEASSQEALATHRITKGAQDLMGVAMGSIIEGIILAASTCKAIMSFNAPFDINILLAEATRIGIDYSGLPEIYCIKQMTRDLFQVPIAPKDANEPWNKGEKYKSLSLLHSIRKISPGLVWRNHDAYHDAESAKQVFIEVLKKIENEKHPQDI